MKMGSGAFTKGVMVLLVALAVLIPVQLLRELIEERSLLRDPAVASVARGWGGKQRVGGPILMIPTTLPGDDGRPRLVKWQVMPESLALKATLTVLDERRKLGVYEVPVYRTSIHAAATFDIAGKIIGLLQSAGATTVASAPSGAGATTTFAGVYALLYLLVTSENYSLLVGSLALFALLAVAMLLTRKLDWYRATARPSEE